MTQEEKQLLLVDLCGRLPYGVIVEHKLNSIRYNITADTYTQFNNDALVVNFRPYLRPMSSMTEEEYYEYSSYDCSTIYDDGKIINHGGGTDWLNKHHFDYRGLIPMGLALEAPEGMYNN